MKGRFDGFRWLGLVCIIIAAIAGATYVYSTIVPFRQFETKMTEGLNRIQANERVERLIKRAKWDFLLAPGPERRDQLHFAEAWQNGDQVQVIFRPAHSSGGIIIYAFRLHDEKPLWKSSAPRER